MPEPAAPAAPTRYLTLEIERKGDLATVRCYGQLVSGLTETLYNRVKPLIPESKRIVLDLCHLSYMDSMGLGTLMSLYTSRPHLRLRDAAAQHRQARPRTPRPHQSLVRIRHHRRTRRQAVNLCASIASIRRKSAQTAIDLPRLRNIRTQNLLRTRCRFDRNPGLALQPPLLALILRLQMMLRQSLLQNRKRVLRRIRKLK